MADRGGRFAPMLDALFRDPDGARLLAELHPRAPRTTATVGAFLDACAGGGRWAEEVAAGDTPGTSDDERARWCALSTIAEAWRGAVDTWLESREARPKGVPLPAREREIELYRRLVVAGCRDEQDLEQITTAGGPERELARALLADGSFRYGYDGTLARVTEVAERMMLARTLLRMTVPGAPPPAAADIRGARREALAGVVEALRASRPAPFSQPLAPIAVGADGDPQREAVCCFARGEDMIVCVCVGDHATGGGGWSLPAWAAGNWHDILAGVGHELPSAATLGGILGPAGRAVLVRSP